MPITSEAPNQGVSERAVSRPPPAGRNWWCLAAAVAGPFVVLTIYLLVSRGIAGSGEVYGDYAAHRVSCAVGIAAVWLSRSRLIVRVAITIPYVPLLWYLLFEYALTFIHLVFGEGS